MLYLRHNTAFGFDLLKNIHRIYKELLLHFTRILLCCGSVFYIKIVKLILELRMINIWRKNMNENLKIVFGLVGALAEEAADNISFVDLRSEAESLQNSFNGTDKTDL